MLTCFETVLIVVLSVVMKSDLQSSSILLADICSKKTKFTTMGRKKVVKISYTLIKRVGNMLPMCRNMFWYNHDFKKILWHKHVLTHFDDMFMYVFVCIFATALDYYNIVQGTHAGRKYLGCMITLAFNLEGGQGWERATEVVML